jgi:hypothetical protein
MAKRSHCRRINNNRPHPPVATTTSTTRQRTPIVATLCHPMDSWTTRQQQPRSNNNDASAFLVGSRSNGGRRTTIGEYQSLLLETLETLQELKESWALERKKEAATTMVHSVGEGQSQIDVVGRHAKDSLIAKIGQKCRFHPVAKVLVSSMTAARIPGAVPRHYHGRGRPVPCTHFDVALVMAAYCQRGMVDCLQSSAWMDNQAIQLSKKSSRLPRSFLSSSMKTASSSSITLW